MRRLFSLFALLGVFGVVGCCHDTCDTCRHTNCPSCNNPAQGHIAPAPVQGAPMPAPGH